MNKAKLEGSPSTTTEKNSRNVESLRPLKNSFSGGPKNNTHKSVSTLSRGSPHFSKTKLSVDSLDIYEVLPIEYNKGRKVLHTYERIITKNLTSSRLRDIYKNLRFKTLPMVSNLLGFFLITYQPKPPILISKTNGRLYALQGKWDLAEVQHQASLVIRVLARVNLVKGHKRSSLWRRKK